MLLSRIYLFITLFTHPHNQPGMYILTGELSCAVGAHWEAGPGSRVGSPHFKLKHVYVKWPPGPQVWEWVPPTPWLCGERIAKQPKNKANGPENSWKVSKRGYNFSSHDLKAVATLEISVVVMQEAENRSISRSSYTTLGHIPKGLCILPQRSLLIHVPCWSILIIGNSLDVTNWWMIMKMRGIYTMEYHFAVRKNELLIFR